MTTERIHWDGHLVTEAVELLRAGGNIVVSPTKVGYIILTSDKKSLERKFAVKNRNRNKPGVVLCGSLEQLTELAELTDEALEFYRTHCEQDILMGCILPWKDSGRAYIPKNGADELVMDARGTSCFVLRFGIPSEQIVQELWEKDRTVVFASSANPSGKGNRGLVAGIGTAIESQADLIIEGDDYVRSIQPDSTADTRYEQGVMVSFVDDRGELVPEQHGERLISPAPTLIRAGLSVDRIMVNLAEQFPSWDYRHGLYY
ncbi:L-threonylcarbamoyladenylate synthase [Populibacterium corticicola]|uniref:L-threonylcarbamoyladenylate synthase n=1 Tax=Populibacterium corticicola TaxID=1812826 RepID=A0ABW5XH01_9MICO